MEHWRGIGYIATNIPRWNDRGDGNWETAGREASEEYCWFTEGYSVCVGMASTLLSEGTNKHKNNNTSLDSLLLIEDNNACSMCLVSHDVNINLILVGTREVYTPSTIHYYEGCDSARYSWLNKEKVVRCNGNNTRYITLYSYYGGP